ncbi:E3 ubiquitin-protein ligase TRIM39-like [Mastacembelus armatus]|uniref:E3 ubiquitin-protein ligase TRIM39-like n=1 Tax=Mastacembelus armatus TaxID=205130 RepID=A0A3Q3M1R4_9TELE|nr:E3 ubiquitin-protein ligase TRIM39-like [Mastacembelus armatus]
MLHLVSMNGGLNMSTQTGSMVLDELFRCCICLDIYTKPVTIPCGHNFCLDCIKGFWDTRDKWECPLCKEAFSSYPALKPNVGFAEIIRSVLPNHDKESDPRLSVEGKVHEVTDPAASQLCGKHKLPLTMLCKNDHTAICVKCTRRRHKNHYIVPMGKECNRIKTNLRETKADIQQMIQARLSKVRTIKNSFILSQKNTEMEIERSTQVCSLLITTIQKHHAGLIKELEEKQEEARKRSQELLNELEQEINELQERTFKLEDLEHIENPLQFLQSYPPLSRPPSMREWSMVTVHSNNCMGTVRKSISKLVDVCQETVNKLSAEEADEMNQYAVDVTLDPETASGWLVLSSDGKKVSLSGQKKTVPENPQRFDSCVCVLGKQSFTSGRNYWVVQVGDKTDWDLGVARESINRKGAVTVRPDSGYWAICRRKGSSLSACTSPSVTLPLKQTPQKIGIFLDYEEGSVAFYDADAKTHIYTYSGFTFTEPLYPYFNPCVHDSGKNTAPLVICPLEERIGEGQDVVIV